jgi:hypothetical protein
MKKIVLLLLLATPFTALLAQKGLHVGFIGGPQFVAQLNKQDFDDANVRYDGVTVRAAFGPTVNYHFNDGIGLGTQFLFSYQGLKYTDLANNEYFRKVTYMKLPILFHANSSPDNVVGGYFYFGPQFSFMLRNDGEINGISLKDNNSIGYSIYSDAHKTVTIGAALGFGILFNVMDGKLQPHLGLRIDGDFTSAFDDEKSKNILSTNGTGIRNATHNVAGLIEIGVKYVLFND